MALPANYSTRTVTGKILDLHSGNPAVGSIKFTPELENQFIFDSGEDTTMAPTFTEAVLDANGEFSVILGTTDDPDIDPNGWTYQVEIITGGVEIQRTVYSVQIPAGAGDLDIADISPTEPTGGQVVLVKSVNGVTPDASGNILLVGLLTILNTNSTFETDTAGWEGSGGTIARSTAKFFNGVASLELTPTGGVPAEARMDLTSDGAPSVVVGETYHAAGWVNSPTGFGTVDIAIDWLDSLDAVISTDISSTVDLLVDRWTYLSLRAVAPAGAFRARVRFREMGTPAATDLLYIDDAILTVQSTPLTLDELQDVVVTTPTNKDVLQFNGTNWVDVALPLDDLGNVSVAAPADNNVLRFDSASGNWEADAGLTNLETQPNRQVFTAGGTWNKPANARFVFIQCQAAGGAGGGTGATNANESAVGAGGGGGGYAESLLVASTLGATETVTVGTGGTGVSGGTGNAGGNSSFGTHVVATGGGGGASMASTAVSTVALAGANGAATAGQVQLEGSDGFNSRTDDVGKPASGGAGGPSHMGGTTRESSVAAGSGANGRIGRLRGGGGSGAVSNEAVAGDGARTGGAGADGIVVVTTYF